MEFRIFDDEAAAKVNDWKPRPAPFLPQAAVADAVAARLARALALTPPRTRSPTYQEFLAADREQEARSEQASALDLTLADIAIGPANATPNPSAFPTFTEWDKVKAAVDPSVERPRPKAPELVSVNHFPWYPIQPICVKTRLEDWEQYKLAKQAEQPFQALSGPRPNGGQDVFNVQGTMSLLFCLLTGDMPSAEEKGILRLHGLPAKYIAFAVNQLATGKDSWTEHKHCHLSEKTFMRLLCDFGRLARTPPEVLFPPNVYNKFQATVEYEACDSMYRAMGNHHFFRAGFIPEVVRAGLDRIPPEHADPEEIAPAIRELMSRRALEKGDGNRWEQHIRYVHKDLFAPADFPSMRHRQPYCKTHYNHQRHQLR